MAGFQCFFAKKIKGIDRFVPMGYSISIETLILLLFMKGCRNESRNDKGQYHNHASNRSQDFRKWQEYGNRFNRWQ